MDPLPAVRGARLGSSHAFKFLAGAWLGCGLVSAWFRLEFGLISAWFLDSGFGLSLVWFGLDLA